MNPYFRDFKIRAYARGFITCLHIRRTKEGRIIERQRAIPIRTIRNIEEIYDSQLGRGIRIDCGDLDLADNVDVFGADMKHAAVAINAAQTGGTAQRQE